MSDEKIWKDGNMSGIDERPKKKAKLDYFTFPLGNPEFPEISLDGVDRALRYRRDTGPISFRYPIQYPRFCPYCGEGAGSIEHHATVADYVDNSLHYVFVCMACGNTIRMITDGGTLND